MSMPCDFDDIHRCFRAVGAALMRVNANNTHSGNMSMRDPLDPDVFYVTASGSQCGRLERRDIVRVSLEDLSCEGSARPSSEANTHRRVLELPGVKACVHCHSVLSTLLGFETSQNPLFLSIADSARSEETECLFQPVDVWGAGFIGSVPVGVYQNTVGSTEMEQRIPAYLRQAPITIVKGHGPFARGESLEQCLHYVTVLENSAAVAFALRRRGVDTLSAQRAIRTRGAEAVFPLTPRRLGSGDLLPQPTAETETHGEFTRWLSYNFEYGLGAFGTGSMSLKLSSDEMIFSPMSAAPGGVAVPLYRIPLRAAEPEADDVRLHRLVFTHTPFSACILASSPLATAEGMAALAAANGIRALFASLDPIERSPDRRPMVVPIDAEAAYYNVRLPVAGSDALAPGSAESLIPSLLRLGGGCCLVAGCGVIAAGEENLGQAAYRVSLAERIARFRHEIDLNHRLLGGPPVEAFE